MRTLQLLLLLVLPAIITSHPLDDHLHSYHVVHASRLSSQHHDQETWILSALGKKFKLELTRNLNLIPKNYKTWEVREDGQLYPSNGQHRTEQDNRHHCHYVGKVAGYSDAESYAAVSLCDGVLHGEIKTPSEFFFVEPHSKHFGTQETQSVKENCMNFPQSSSPECALHHEHLSTFFGLSDSNLKSDRAVPHVLYTPKQMKPQNYRCPVEGDHVLVDESRNPDEHGHAHGPLLGSGSSESTIHGVERKLKFGTTVFSDVKYVEMLVVNDKTRVTSKGSASAAESNSATLINIAHTRYLFNRLSPAVAVVLTAQISVTAANDPWGTPATCSTPMYAGAIDHSDLLSKFETWAWTTAKNSISTRFDNAHLLSGYHFCGATVGYAPVGSMCLDTYSTGISQPLYIDQQSANIIVHEMGHNFNMLHDSSGNSCPSSGFIMAAVGNLESSEYATNLSDCSKTYYNQMMTYRPTSTTCLDNIPELSWSVSCGNGYLDDGEQCDCGSSDCSTLDPCCNGATCQLVNGAQCSSNDLCCSNCRIVSASANKRCRPAKSSTCDTAEYCDGTSSACPGDNFTMPGTTCQDQFSNNGLCFNGACVTTALQCKGIYDSNTGPCYTPSNPCGQSLLCNSDSNGGCTAYQVGYGDGTPCSGASNGMCFNDTCVDSSRLLYFWQTYCNKSCDGTFVQSIRCRKHDGSWMDDSYCALPNLAGTKPSQPGPCSGFAPQLCSVGTNVSGIVASGNVLNITWSTVSPVDFVSILTFSEKYHWPSYVAVAVTSTSTAGYYLYTVPSVFPQGNTYARVYAAASVSKDTDNFTVSDFCLSVACSSNGNCIDGLCDCSQGFSGTLCDQDLCAASGHPCISGSCGTSAATCTCSSGWTGKTCSNGPSCSLSSCSSTHAEVYNCSCKCVGGWTGSSCDSCGLSCGSNGAPDENCEKCTCNSWFTGSSCDKQFAYLTLFFSLPSTETSRLLKDSSSANKWEQQRFAQLLEYEIAYIVEVDKSRVSVPSTNFSSTADNHMQVRFLLIGPDADKANMEGVITKLKDALKNQYGTWTRMYAFKNVDTSIDMVIEGNDLFPPEKKKSFGDRINEILAWIKANLVIVIPVAVVVGLLIIYKVWYDRKHSGDKVAIAGVRDQEEELIREAAVRPRRQKSVRDDDVHEKDRKKKKKKRPVQKERKDRVHRQGEQELENEFGMRVVRKSAPESPPDYNVEEEEDGQLPPNWSVQYFDDGTKFYFNSATNDISSTRPKR